MNERSDKTLAMVGISRKGEKGFKIRIRKEIQPLDPDVAAIKRKDEKQVVETIEGVH